MGLEGLVEAFPRRGYRVTAVTIKDVNDLFAVRAMLEGTAGAMAAVNLTDAELNRLEALADASYVVGENVSVQSFVGANEEFHSEIARASRNPRLYELVMSHLEECARFFYMGAQARDVNPETNTDHHRIVDVLRGRDPEKARAVMVEHNENTRRGLTPGADRQTGSAAWPSRERASSPLCLKSSQCPTPARNGRVGPPCSGGPAEHSRAAGSGS